MLGREIQSENEGDCRIMREMRYAFAKCEADVTELTQRDISRIERDTLSKYEVNVIVQHKAIKL